MKKLNKKVLLLLIMMLSVLSQQTLYCQSGNPKNEYVEALSNCDYTNGKLERQIQGLSIELDQLKFDLSICNKSDSTKSEAIKKLIYEKSILLNRIEIYDKKEKLNDLTIVTLENKNKKKWWLGLTGIIIGIFISKI